MAGPLPHCPAGAAPLQRLSATVGHLTHGDPQCDRGALLQHLSESAEAIQELQHVRRAARDLLEEQTIDTSQARFTALHLPGHISREIRAAVSRVRESSASQLRLLHSELRGVSQEAEELEQGSLPGLSSALRHQEASDRHQHVVHLLNLHMTRKAGENIALNEAYSAAKEAQQTAIDLKHSAVDLHEELLMERERHATERDQLQAEITELELEIQSKEKRHFQEHRRLGKVLATLSGREAKIDTAKEAVSSVNYHVSQLKTASAILAKQLDRQTRTAVELCAKKSYLESHLSRMKEACTNETENLNAKIVKTDDDAQKAKCLNESLRKTNTILNQQFLSARGEGETERGRRQDTAQQFEKATAVLEEKLGHVAKLRMEIKGMVEEIGKIKESSRLITDVCGTQVEESRERLQQERLKRTALQMKQDEITAQAALRRHSEDTHVQDMTERLDAAKIKSSELTKEAVHLQRDIMQSESQIKRLTEEQMKTEEENTNLEHSYLSDIENLKDKSNASKENLQNKVKELQVTVHFLHGVQSTFDEENRKYEDIKQQVGDLKHKRKVLADAINVKKNELDVLSNAKEKQRKELQSIREAICKTMKRHTEETKIIERNIYETNRKLELVNMENCRFKLSNSQKNQDILNMLQEAQSQKAESVNMDSDWILLHDRLLKGWAQDSATREDWTEHEQETLEAIIELVMKIQQREEKLGTVTNQLQEALTGNGSPLQGDSRGQPCKAEADLQNRLESGDSTVQHIR